MVGRVRMLDGWLSFTRRGETGPIEVWAINVGEAGALRLATPAEPVFVFDWKPRSPR
jgi:hypothetical protein